jgi:hypothetical protein
MPGPVLVDRMMLWQSMVRWQAGTVKTMHTWDVFLRGLIHKRQGDDMTETLILQELQNIRQDMVLIRQRIESLLRVLNLLEQMVLDRRKVHAGMQKHALERDIFVTICRGRQIKAHADMVKPDMGTNSNPVRP